MIKLILKIILLCISILLFWYFFTDCSADAEIHMKSYGQDDESVKILLDRTVWANKYHARTNPIYRDLLASLIIAFFNVYIFFGEINVLFLIQSTIICFAVISTLFRYQYHHSDKLEHYAVDKNLRIIRQKLRFKKYTIPPVSKETDFGPSAPFDYYCDDD